MQSSGGCEVHGIVMYYVAPPAASLAMPAYLPRIFRQPFTERKACIAATSRRTLSSLSWSKQLICFMAMSGRPFLFDLALRCDVANTQ